MNTTPREMKVVIRGKSENATKMILTSGKFSMVIDEPPSLSGTDDGPSPVQVLLMSLAGCLNVTGHEIAKQKGLKLNGMETKIEGVMNPCAFIGCSFEERSGFQQIQVTVDADMPGATQEEIDAWLEETESRCPVTDNVRADTKISVIGTKKLIHVQEMPPPLWQSLPLPQTKAAMILLPYQNFSI